MGFRGVHSELRAYRPAEGSGFVLRRDAWQDGFGTSRRMVG
jgi:hypothetical protein